MPQLRKDCNITINHQSYTQMETIFDLYTEPHLYNILADQIAYNCAIRKACYDKSLISDNIQSKDGLLKYGLNTFEKMDYIQDELEDDFFEVSHSADILYLNYPFIYASDGDYEEEWDLDDIKRYPKVYKPFTKKELEYINNLQTAGIQEILPPIRNSVNNKKIPFLDKSLSKLSSNLTRAFYFFDAINFYGYTQSMLSRSGHENRTFKNLLNTIEPYILENQYFELI